MIIKRDERILDARYLSREGDTGTRWWSAMRGRNRLSVFNGSVVSSEVVLGGRPGQLVFSGSGANGTSVVIGGELVPYDDFMLIRYVTTADAIGELSVAHDGTVFNGWKLSRAYSNFVTWATTPFTGTSNITLNRYVSGSVVSSVSIADGWYYSVVPNGTTSLTGVFVTNMGALYRLAKAIDPSIASISFDTLSSMSAASTATSITRTIKTCSTSTGGGEGAVICGPTVYTSGIINTFIRAYNGVWTPDGISVCPV